MARPTTYRDAAMEKGDGTTGKAGGYARNGWSVGLLSRGCPHPPFVGCDRPYGAGFRTCGFPDRAAAGNRMTMGGPMRLTLSALLFRPAAEN